MIQAIREDCIHFIDNPMSFEAVGDLDARLVATRSYMTDIPSPAVDDDRHDLHTSTVRLKWRRRLVCP